MLGGFHHVVHEHGREVVRERAEDHSMGRYSSTLNAQHHITQLCDVFIYMKINE